MRGRPEQHLVTVEWQSREDLRLHQLRGDVVNGPQMRGESGRRIQVAQQVGDGLREEPLDRGILQRPVERCSAHRTTVATVDLRLAYAESQRPRTRYAIPRTPR